MEKLSKLALLQGAYYTASGIWPIADIESFEAVTGPKLERWLVKTVGAVVTAVGGTLLLAGLRRDKSPVVPTLGASTAAALAAVDIIYSAKRRISPVYLLDAVAEVALIRAWARAALLQKHRAEFPRCAQDKLPYLEGPNPRHHKLQPSTPTEAKLNPP